MNKHSEFHPAQHQIAEAENAFNGLRPRYLLTSAVDFFLKHRCEPDVILSLEDAMARFLDAKAGQIRDRSRVQLKSTLSQFKEFSENCHLHEVTQQMVERFLRSIRAKHGKNPAAKRTWNN